MPGELLPTIDGLVALLAECDPGTSSVAECTMLDTQLARLENASAAARAAAASVVNEGAEWLARTTGTSTRQAESELSTSSRLDDLPALAKPHDAVTYHLSRRARSR